MFGKLLKNDLKAQWHSMSTIFSVIIAVALIGEACTIFSDNQTVIVLGGLAVILAMLFAAIFIIIAVAMLFSKTMFGRAGYLTLTLPVKTSSLIWSKTVSGLVWAFAVYFLFIGSFFLWVYQVKETLGGDVVESAEAILSLFGVPSFKVISIVVIFFSVSLAISILLIVQSLYFGVTCSNISPVSKFGNLGAIVIFAITFLVLQKISTEISALIPFGMVVSPDLITFTSNTNEAALNAIDPVKINFAGPLLRLLFGIVLHFPIVYLTKNKVNVK